MTMADETPVPEGEALEELGRSLSMDLELSPDEQADFDRNLARLRQLGYGEPDTTPSLDADEPEPDGDDEEADDEDEEEESDGGATDETPAPPPPVAASPPATFDIAGRRVSAGEAQQLVELQEYLRANPAVAAEFSRLVDRQNKGLPLSPEPTSAPPPEELPAWLEDADEHVVAMWRDTQSLKADLAAMRRMTEESQRQAQAATERAAALEAIARWESAHPELDSDSIEKVRLETASLRIIPGLVEQYGNVQQAVTKALDLAYYSMPEFRPSAPDPAPAAADRKRKISSVTGSRAPSIRPKPRRPASYEDMRQEAAKFISENDLG